MFTIDDLWSIMKFLQDGTTDPNLSELTTTLATSEKELTTTYFETTLDQPSFSTDDYKRLRKMFIDWYSSHKTISTTQRFATEVHQLPNDDLSELFRSFGYTKGLDLVPLTSKANFFLDLVNFYKKKGTPETLVDVLDYYGFSDTDLIEYWLQKDMFGNIIFRGESVRLSATGSTILLDSDVPFEKLVGTDPHWFQSKAEIETLLLTNKISLPSKSPYYSLSSIFSLFQITISLSILFRIVEDQYDRYIAGEELPYNTPVKNLGLVLPILHIYVGTIYAFEKLFGYGSATTFTKYGCYNGTVQYNGDPPVPIDLSNLVEEYEDLIVRPTSRLDRDTRLETLINDWSRPLSGSFLNSINAAEPLLDSLNPNFKNLIDSWFDIGDQNYLMTYLIGTLDNWIRLNVDSKSPSLVVTMLGLGFREELIEIINFFKPYRARLAFMDTAFSIKNPLQESVILDEWLMTSIEGFYRDAIRPFSFDGDLCLYKQLCGMSTIPPNPIPLPPGFAGWCSLFRWDMGGVFDIPPVDQMDAAYLEDLNEYLRSIHIGTICDNVEIGIEQSFNDILGLSWPKQYDVGYSYDTPIQWDDAIFIDFVQEAKGNDENIEVTDNPEIVLQQTVMDVEYEFPNQFDIGQSFDTPQPRSIVRDSFHIDISSLAIADATTNVSAILTTGLTEPLSSGLSSTTNIFDTELIIGATESISSTNNVVSFVIIEPILMGLNYYWDRDGVFDTPPKAT